MNPEQTNKSNSTDFIRCPLHAYGCDKRISRNQLSEHCVSQQHYESMAKYICSGGVKYEGALIELALAPYGNDEFLTALTVFVDQYQRVMQRLTGVFIEENVPQSYPTDAVPSEPSNLERIYTTTESSATTLIQNMDRTLSHETHNVQSHQEERRLNTNAMNDLLNRIASSPAGDHVDQHMGQNQDPRPDNEQQSMIEFLKISNSVLQTDLNSKPVSTDGHLPWFIDKTHEKIENAISGKEKFIDSDGFKTSTNGNLLRARLYFNGRTDKKFISIHVLSDNRVTEILDGTITFILVDQSSNNILQHQKRCWPNEKESFHELSGFDKFVDKNLLHQAGNRYVNDDDTICILIYVKPTNEKKFDNYSANVRDAFKLLQ